MAATSTDIIVVGAGVIGLASAFTLAREGKQVLLLDRNPPGSGASFGNAGHIATEQLFPLASPAVVRGALGYLLDAESPLRLRLGYLLPITPWLVRFALAARKRRYAHGVAALSALQKTAAADIAKLLQEANAAHLLKMNGHLVLVEKAASRAAANEDIAIARALGIDVDWISSAEVRRLAPEITAPLEGALRFSGSGQVDDPHAVCMALYAAFLAAGGKFQQSEVRHAARRADGFTIQTTSATLHGKQLLLAAGAWSKPLAAQLGYPVPLDTERGYHITLPSVTPIFTVPIASYERKVIMTPMSCGLRMTGTVEFGGLYMPPDERRFTLLKRHLKALAANISTDTATTWMGFRPSLPDHLPVLGRAPGCPDLFFAFGHQHLGLTLAGVTARIIADGVMGRQTDVDLAPFSSRRFPLRSLGY